MNSLTGWRSRLLLGGMEAVFAAGLAHLGQAAPAVPDPCKLVTAVEVERIAGPLMGGAPSPPADWRSSLAVAYADG